MRQIMRRLLALVIVAGCALMACTSKTPEERYAERMSRLTKKAEKLQEQIHVEQHKEIQRRRDTQKSMR